MLYPARLQHGKITEYIQNSLLYSITNITVSLAEVLVFYQLTDSEFYLVKL